MTQNRTRRLVVIAMLSAISTLLMQFTEFPLLGPPLDFLKVEISIVPILFGLFIMGLSSAFVILLLRSLLYLLLFNAGASSMIGLPMNIVALGLFVVFIHFLTKKSQPFTLLRFIVGGGLGTLALTLAMLVLNYFYAIPMYEIFANFRLEYIGMTRVDYLLVGVLPFNLLQGAILTVLSVSILSPMRKMIAQENLRYMKNK